METVDDIDRETLEQAAAEALERPSNAAMRDGRCYTTHGVTFSWAVNSDDITAESNYWAALKRVCEAAREAGEDSDEYVIDGSVSDWAVGPMQQMFVRVRGEGGQFTAAFTEATRCALHIRDYSILDEDDHEERENAAWEANVEAAVTDAQRETLYADDTDEQKAAIRESADEDISQERTGGADVDWKGVAAVYKEHRDMYFEGLAAARADGYRPSTEPWDCTGQLTTEGQES